MTITEENELEAILTLAASEPAHRPQFCNVLMNSQVYVLGSAGQSGVDGKVNLQAGSSVQIQHWERPDGSPVIPFFSSLHILQESIGREEPYFALFARSLFEMTQGATLVLNPKSAYGKEFVPEEVAHLLTIGLSQTASRRVVEQDAQVLLGQPSDYPSTMVDSLTQLFAKHKNVKKAYLALMHDASVQEEPHLLVGIDAEGDVENIIREAGNVASDTAPEGRPVDLYRVTEGESEISHYFIHQTKPFYERKWGKKLKTFLGTGKA